jgi:plastocyanin
MLDGMTSSRRPLAARFLAKTSALMLAFGLGAVAVTSAGATTPNAKSPSVTIKNLAFSPKTLNVKAGAKVTVKNKDGTTHTFTANKGAFDTGDIDGGSSATITVKKPGTYAYHCNIHNFMKGTIKAT